MAGRAEVVAQLASLEVAEVEVRSHHRPGQVDEGVVGRHLVRVRVGVGVGVRLRLRLRLRVQVRLTWLGLGLGLGLGFGLGSGLGLGLWLGFGHLQPAAVEERARDRSVLGVEGQPAREHQLQRIGLGLGLGFGL